MKIRNQKGEFALEALLAMIGIAMVLPILVMILQTVDMMRFRIKYEKEINAHAELIAKHHESKSGHFVISSYEDCMKKNDQLFGARVTKAECIQMAMNGANVLEHQVSTEEGIQHLRQYMQENEEYEKRMNSLFNAMKLIKSINYKEQ